MIPLVLLSQQRREDSLTGQRNKGGNFDSFQESNYQIGIAILSPDVIDQFWPTLKITKFGLLGEAKSGSYVDETDGISLEILLAKKLF